MHSVKAFLFDQISLFWAFSCVPVYYSLLKPSKYYFLLCLILADRKCNCDTHTSTQIYLYILSAWLCTFNFIHVIITWILFVAYNKCHFELENEQKIYQTYVRSKFIFYLFKSIIIIIWTDSYSTNNVHTCIAHQLHTHTGFRNTTRAVTHDMSHDTVQMLHYKNYNTTAKETRDMCSDLNLSLKKKINTKCIITVPSNVDG
jgi:hypothetical protein